MIKPRSNTEIIFYGLSLASIDTTGRAFSNRPVFLCTFKNDFIPEDIFSIQYRVDDFFQPCIHVFPARMVLVKKAVSPQLIFPANSIAWGNFELMEYCFSQGIGDFSCAPFNPEEIGVRSEHLLQKLRFNDYLTAAGKALSTKEKLVFSILYCRQGEQVSRKEIAFYSKGVFTVKGRNIDMCISRIRKKVEPFGIRIESVCKCGYQLNFS